MSVSLSTSFEDLMKWSSFSLDDVLGRLNQTHVLNWKINKIPFLLFKKKILNNYKNNLKCKFYYFQMQFANFWQFLAIVLSTNMFCNKWMFENCDFTWSWFLKCQFSFQNGKNVEIFVEIKMTRQHWRVLSN